MGEHHAERDDYDTEHHAERDDYDTEHHAERDDYDTEHHAERDDYDTEHHAERDDYDTEHHAERDDYDTEHHAERDDYDRTHPDFRSTSLSARCQRRRWISSDRESNVTVPRMNFLTKRHTTGRMLFPGKTKKAEEAGQQGPVREGRSMHIPDMVLDSKIAVVTSVVGAAGLILALRKLERQLGDRTTVMMGTMSAFVFAAQMVNFPVGPDGVGPPAGWGARIGFARALGGRRGDRSGADRSMLPLCRRRRDCASGPTSSIWDWSGRW